MTTIPPPPPPPKNRRGPSLILRLGQAKADLDQAQARYNALVDQARRELGTGRYVEGDVEVLIVRNRTWDRDKAYADYGDAICSMMVDLKMARYALTGEAFERYYVEGAPRVIVKERDDDAE